MFDADDKQRAGSIVEMHDDLNAVDEDEFDRIIEKDKAARRSKYSGQKAKKRVK